MIRGLNWFGFETEYANLMCTWNGDIAKHIDMIEALDFNYIRLPFSLDFIVDADWVHMDEFFELAEEKDLKVLLDFHRLENTHQSPVPYNDKYSFEDFLQGWITILDRYDSYGISNDMSNISLMFSPLSWARPHIAFRISFVSSNISK